MSHDPDPDKVGYGKPPRHSRFKPGQSGNPKGRVKGQRGLKTDLQAALNAKQTIKVDGRLETARRQKLMMETLAIRAALGDLKAMAILLPHSVQMLGIEDRGVGKQQLSQQDQAILDDFLKNVAPPSRLPVPGQGEGSAENESMANPEGQAQRGEGSDDA